MAKIMHINGEVRAVATRTKQGTNEVYGSSLTILSEPKGDTVDVLAFSRVIDPAEAVSLEGTTIDATVSVDVNAGTRGGAFLNILLVSVDSVEAPNAAPVAAESV